MICKWKNFMANTCISKLKLSYLKPSFGLGIYFTILFMIYNNFTNKFNLHVWIHVIYPYKIFINGSQYNYIYI